MKGFNRCCKAACHGICIAHGTSWDGDTEIYQAKLDKPEPLTAHGPVNASCIEDQD